jgi:uncharacterized protein YpuA (DUF1002 family)
VTRAELIRTLEMASIPVDPSEEAISSIALSCLPEGAGLRVRTQHVTRLPAAAYAAALLTAGVSNVSAAVAAPAASPVTGETALVGLLQAAAICRPGQQLEAARIELTYQQIRLIMTDVDPDVSIPTADVVVRAVHAVLTGRAPDASSIGAVLDSALVDAGLAISPTKRSELLAVLTELHDVAAGSIVTAEATADAVAVDAGSEIQQLDPEEVRIAR